MSNPHLFILPIRIKVRFVGSMSFLELIVVGLALFMLLPRWLEGAKLDYLTLPLYIIIGIIIGPAMNIEAKELLGALAEGGFILLLFSVGLEIKIPESKQILPALTKGIIIYSITYFLAFCLASGSGLGVTESLICAAALAGISVGLVFNFLDTDLKDRWGGKFLHVFIALELISLAVFSLGEPILRTGIGALLGLKVLGIILLIFLISRLARRFSHMLAIWLEKTTHYRAHLLLFIIFAISAIGERFGLSAPKTAFFLGLFMTYTKPFGELSHTTLTSVGERFLIPIFLISLGTYFDWGQIDAMVVFPAILTAMIIWAVRYYIFSRGLGGGHAVSTLSSVNLTMVAISLEVLSHHHGSSQAILWVLIAGTVGSLTGLLSTKPKEA